MRILNAIFLYFLLSLSFTTHAQISIGIKAGPDFSKFVNAVQGNDGSGNISTLNSGSVTQVYGGLFVDLPLDGGKNFYIRPGVNYIGAGGQMNGTGNYYTANGFAPNTKYTLRYVDVPVEFVYSPGFDWGRPYIGLGFYGGALGSGKIKNPDGSSHKDRWQLHRQFRRSRLWLYLHDWAGHKSRFPVRRRLSARVLEGSARWRATNPQLYMGSPPGVGC